MAELQLAVFQTVADLPAGARDDSSLARDGSAHAHALSGVVEAAPGRRTDSHLPLCFDSGQRDARLGRREGIGTRAQESGAQVIDDLHPGAGLQCHTRDPVGREHPRIRAGRGVRAQSRFVIDVGAEQGPADRSIAS